MKWGPFKDRVNALLATDEDRLGLERYTPETLLQVTMMAQRLIPHYQTGHQTRFTAADMTVNGEASRGRLPLGRIVTMTVIREEQGTTIEREAIEEPPTKRQDLVFGAQCLNDGSPRYVVRKSWFYLFPKLRPAGGFLTGENMISAGAQFSGILSDPENPPPDGSSGAYVVTLTQGSTYRIVLGANEVAWTDGTLDGTEIVTYSSDRTFVAYSTTLTIYGNGPGNNVTAQLYAVDAEDAPSVDDQLICDWDGIKTDFSDHDDTPFDDQLVVAIAEGILSQIRMAVDSAPQASAMHDRQMRRILRQLRTQKMHQ